MSKWKIDPDHTVAAFAIQHMTLVDVRGQFNRVTGTIAYDPDSISNTSIEFEIDAAGIHTGIQKRDDHLKSADFFDIDTFPKITFKSTSVEKVSSNICAATGDVSIHGITKEMTVDVAYYGPVKSPFGETTMGFSARVRINREDFGLTWNQPLENGGFMVGKDVQLFIDIEADLEE